MCLVEVVVICVLTNVSSYILSLVLNQCS